jgi:uncharacterized membrane protein
VAAVVLYAVVLSALSVSRHESYSSARYDLGNMDQAVWSTAYDGRLLATTDESGELTSRLRNHADPLLLLFVPLYWIQPSPIWLLVAQAAVVGLGAWPLFRLCERSLGRIPGCDPGPPAALFAVAYLFNYGLQSANLFDFHPQTLAGTFLLFALWFMVRRRLWPFVLFAVLAASTKENVALPVAMLGVYAIFGLRRPRWGVPIFAFGAAYFSLLMFLVIPAFNAGESSRLVAERYGEVGGSVGGVVETALTDPLLVARHAFTPEKLAYLFSVAGSAGLLGLFAPLVLVIPAPEIAINLLSDRPQMVDLSYHYSASIIPFAFLASAAGLANLAVLGLRLRERWPTLGLPRRAPREVFTSFLPLAFALWVLALGVYFDYREGPLPWSMYGGARSPVVMPRLPEGDVANLDRAVALVPKDPTVEVSASNWIGAHLSHRRDLYLFPEVRDADYVVVDLRRPSYYTSFDYEKAGAAFDRLRKDPGYRIIYRADNVAVFEKVGARTPTDPPARSP